MRQQKCINCGHKQSSVAHSIPELLFAPAATAASAPGWAVPPSGTSWLLIGRSDQMRESPERAPSPACRTSTPYVAEKESGTTPVTVGTQTTIRFPCCHQGDLTVCRGPRQRGRGGPSFSRPSDYWMRLEFKPPLPSTTLALTLHFPYGCT